MGRESPPLPLTQPGVKRWLTQALRASTRTCQILGTNRIPILLATWLTVIFAERLVIDRWLFRYGEGPHLGEAAADIAVWAYLLLGLPLLTLGLTISKQSAERTEALLRRVVRATLDELRGYRIYSIAICLLFLVYVFQHLEEPLSIWQAARGFVGGATNRASWSGRVREAAQEIGYLLLALGVASGGQAVFRSLAKLLERYPRLERIRDAFASWRLSSGFFFINLAVYFTVYWLSLGVRLQHDPVWPFFGTGFLKDAAIYYLMAFGVVNSMLRWERSATNQTWAGRWHFLGVFWLGVFLTAVLALAMDIAYVGGIADQASKFAQDYPAPWQRDIVHIHVYVRDVGLMVPLLGVVFVRTVGSVLAAKRATTARRTATTNPSTQPRMEAE